MSLFSLYCDVKLIRGYCSRIPAYKVRRLSDSTYTYTLLLNPITGKCQVAS